MPAARLAMGKHLLVDDRQPAAMCVNRFIIFGNGDHSHRDCPEFD
jgi:hypothetical protein